MRQFGLIGKVLTHSFSPQYFKTKFNIESIQDARYSAYEIDSAMQILELFNEGIKGLNVTIPFKEEVIPFLDDLDDSALSIMAVNTIKRVGNKLIGYNTDVYGFQKSLEHFLEGKIPGNALILGTGGAAKAVAYVLSLLDIPFKHISRTKPEMSYCDLNKKIIDEHKLIINTTPLGMYPKVDISPDIPYAFLSEKHFVYDLIYNPEKTLFLRRSERQNAKIKNGYEMLVLQAEKSWSIWNSQ